MAKGNKKTGKIATPVVEEKLLSNGKTAVLNYTGRLEDGQIFDTSIGRASFQFKMGASQVIPAFESSVLNKPIGYKATIKIAAESAYGLVREDLIVKVPADNVPKEVQVGQVLNANAQGQDISVTVKEINSEYVLVDGNHPLAGKNLEFDIEILDILDIPGLNTI